MLSHRAIRIHSADYIFTVLDEFHTNIFYLQRTKLETEITFSEKENTRSLNS